MAVARDRLKVALTRFPSLYDRLRRPYALGRFLLRRPHDGEFAAFALFPGREGVFLDVGANAGMSALSFRIYDRRMPIVSIEPNPFHEGDLRFVTRLARPFTYRLWAAGEYEGSMTLHVPVFKGVPLTTEASLLRDEVVDSPSLRDRLGSGMDGDAFSIVTRTVPLRPLDTLGVRPAFIKLDVQGFELQALRGLERTIAQARPVLFIESPDDTITDWLAARRYAAFRYLPEEHALTRTREGALNIIFVPEEEVER